MGREYPDFNTWSQDSPIHIKKGYTNFHFHFPFSAILSTFYLFYKKTKKLTPLFHPKSYFFCELKSHTKFWNPTITPSRRKVSRRKERREITRLIVDTEFRDSACKLLGPKFVRWNPNILGVRSPCKISKPYDNPFMDFSYGVWKEERILIYQ